MRAGAIACLRSIMTTRDPATARARSFRRVSAVLLTAAWVLRAAGSFATTGQEGAPPGTVSAAETPEKIEPDQPDVTNGTHIVDPGLLQIEVGGVLSQSGSSQNLGTPVTFRVGLTDWVEVRVGSDGLLSATDPAGNQSGIGNVQLAAKFRLWATPGGVPVLSLLPTVNLATASEAKGLGSGQSDFTLALLTGSDFLTRGHADVNYGIGRIGSGPGLPRFTQQLVSLSVSAEVPGPVTPYAEIFWISRQTPDGGPVLAIDAGAIWVLTPRFALDGGAQGGLSAAAPSVSIFGGVSVIVGDVLGEHGVHARQRNAARRGAPVKPR
jgi:hypothetical protein